MRPVSPRFIAADRPLADGRVVIFGIPFEGRVNLRKGADGGPRDVRLASDSIETYSPYLDRDLEEVLRNVGLEERVYRFRCVEAWSFVAPWTGIPLAAFVAWFPQLVAGPIGRATMQLPQFERDRVRPTGDQVRSGLLLIVIGLVKKVAIADALAPFVNTAFGNPDGAGAGTLLVLDQTKNLLGLAAVGEVEDHFLIRFWGSLVDGGGIHPATASIGLGTIALVLGLRRVKAYFGWRLLPDLMITVAIMASLTAWLGLDGAGVRVVGEIPAVLPAFGIPQFDLGLMRELSGGALAIAVLQSSLAGLAELQVWLPDEFHGPALWPDSVLVTADGRVTLNDVVGTTPALTLHDGPCCVIPVGPP